MAKKKKSKTKAKPAEEKQKEEEEIVQPDRASLGILADVVDHHVELIFAERSNRLERWVTLNYFWGTHPANDVEFGRLYARRYMAELLIDGCTLPPYGYNDNGNPITATGARNPLAKWEASTWNDFINDLLDLRKKLLRMDATAIVEDIINLQENSEVNDELAKLPIFSSKFEHFIKAIKANEIIAPIRWELEEQLRAQKTEYPDLPRKSTFDLVCALNDCGNDSVVQAVNCLFAATPALEREGNEKYKPIKELVAVLDSRPFSLHYLQDKMETMLRKMGTSALGTEDPVLFRLRYQITPRSNVAAVAATPPVARHSGKKASKASKADMDRLRNSRQALGESHGEDPLEESRKVAAEAVGETMDEGDAKKRGLTIEEMLDADDLDDEHERVALSEMPRKRARRVSTPKAKFPPPDEGLFNEEGKVTYRRKWTEEEKEALKQGVSQFGVGKWAKIKEKYAEILRNRTSVQIKDCWRTMTRNNEV